MSISSTLWWPLLLSSLAGISTAVGGLIAISFNSNNSTLAFLLGTAIGVMATVSGVELWWHSAVQLHDWVGVTAAVALGAVAFAILDPLLPSHHDSHEQLPEHVAEAPASTPDNAAAAHSSSSSCHAPQGSAAILHPAGHQALLISCEDSSRQQLENVSLVERMKRLVGSVAGNRRLQSQPHGLVRGGSSNAVDILNVPDAEVQIGAVPLLDKARIDSSSSSSSSSNRCRESLPVSNLPRQHDMQQQQLQCLELEPGMSHSRHVEQIPSNSSDHSSSSSSSKEAGLLRLALVMALTMTLHNLPEGFAVAFSAFTDIGPIMTLAIALHNIPEGLVIAAPLYAATGSKLKALGLALASGLSEPLGALIALLVFKPFVTSVKQLDYVLAFTGGIMLSVCVLELIPEGRRCGRNRMLIGGVVLGTVVMGWTLWMGA